MATTESIRLFISRAQLKQAVEDLQNVTVDTELALSATALAQAFHSLNRQIIAGIMDINEENMQRNKLVRNMLLLIDEYEMLRLKNVKDGLDSLKSGLKECANDPDVGETLERLEEISGEMEVVKTAGSSKEVKPKIIEKLRSFIVTLSNPESTAGKAVTLIKTGSSTVIEIVKSYNSIAYSFGLPAIPMK